MKKTMGIASSSKQKNTQSLSRQIEELGKLMNAAYLNDDYQSGDRFRQQFLSLTESFNPFEKSISRDEVEPFIL